MMSTPPRLMDLYCAVEMFLKAAGRLRCAMAPYLLLQWPPVLGSAETDLGEIKQTADGQYQIETMMKKTKHSVSVPLSENALSFLPERGGAKDNDRVFSKLPDQPGNADARLKTLIRHAGIDKKVSFHVGRHTFATLTLTYGADLYTVSKLLGHSNIRTTQIYAKIVDENKRKAVNLVPKK